ncbi:MAG: single-stranded-DNA-specific exonuclease RecJ [Phycisphaeraceae bacterium]|nr:single-stranded-DNA-specific exonuclease RecJ [Phycisphaeraceae bacterium]
MNGFTSRWIYRLPGGDASAGPVRAADARLVDRVLAARGIDPAAPDAAAFLDPRLNHLHDPSLIPGVDRAAARLLEALRAGETIAIYGDYDVDGITATAILYHMMLALEPGAAGRIMTYVPHRLEEGYGLNAEAMGELAGRGAKVIVSVDCGVTAFAPAQRAKAEGVDLIITDHHNPPMEGEGLPDAYAVVHPRAPGSAYPFADLCGAGVAYKLAWRMATMHERSAKLTPALRALLVDLLAFAALGTIADVVPLVGENRVIARFGLVRVGDSPFGGLRALVEASRLDGGRIDAMDVGFRIAPRLNAAGRMGHAKDAVELFTTASDERAAQIARELTVQNDERRRVEKRIFDQACEMAEAAGMTGPDRRAVVLAHDDWHPGVVGIVCSKVVERYSRPAILMQRKEGLCSGSGRSIEGFNLHAGLTACGPMLERFGGHDMAAGLHLVEAKLHAFTEAFTAHANSLIREEMLCPLVKIDCDAALEELTPQAVRDLDLLEPFGRDNPRVVLAVRGVRLIERKTFGTGARHLSVALRAADSRGGSGGWANGGGVVRAIAWNRADLVPRLAPGSLLDVAVRPALSHYGGRTTVEPQIEDIRLHEEE